MSNRERPRPAPFVAGLAGGVVIALIGVWLLLAPFAVGYQPEGADWIEATTIGVVTGVVLVVLGLFVTGVVATALRDEIRRHGLAPATRRPSPQHPTSPPGSEQPNSPDGSELEALLEPLTAALLEDLRGSGQPSAQPSAQARPGSPEDHRFDPRSDHRSA
ncbi:MAG: hypothetical protein ACLFRD_11170 [Nitriliruptoraceae bacterium]